MYRKTVGCSKGVATGTAARGMGTRNEVDGRGWLGIAGYRGGLQSDHE